MATLFAAGRIPARKQATERGIPKASLTFLVNRMHVGRSNVDVVRELSWRMDRTEWTRERRKEAYRYAIALHRRNFAAYAYAMGFMGKKVANNLHNRGE